jgi:RNA polymerase sigma-70 factor (sigma-E family)
MVSTVGEGTSAEPHAPAEAIDIPADRDRGFEALYQREYEPMLRVAYLMLSSRESAEEAVHDAFAKVYERWDRTDNPGGYLRTCVLNRCRDLGRRRLTATRRRRERVEDQELEARELLDALAALPVKRRAAIVLRYYEGLSEAEIASALGVAPGTVKSLVSRGLDQLRKEITL